MLAGLVTEQPVALLLEDLHWADPSTTQPVNYLANTLSDERLLLLATVRDEVE